MFSNKHDSTIKDYIENTWYKNNMTNYTKYLEDTVWCNDRRYEDSYNDSGWNPNGGEENDELRFGINGEDIRNISLNCRPQDSLTVNNGGVRYPVGLMTHDEFIITLFTGGNSWAMTASYASTNRSKVFLLDDISSYTNVARGVRPVVSLKYGLVASDGDGTPTNPYIIAD